jgi:amino-acid N-acetyltransferase
MTAMPPTIRPAVASDQATITAIVRAARINPRRLDWQRFLVADENGHIVGVGQVKRHGDGSRELASLAVIPERQGRGVGGAIVRALLGREPGPVYLMCMDWLEPYYQGFGFRRLERDELPTSFRGIARFAPALATASSLFGKRLQLIVMRRL